MADYVDHDSIVSIDQVSDDNTIGLIHFADDVDGDLFHPRRLREALILAEEELAIDDAVEIARIEDDPELDRTVPGLVITSQTGRSGVVLAGKHPAEDGDLPTGDDGEGS